MPTTREEQNITRETNSCINHGIKRNINFQAEKIINEHEKARINSLGFIENVCKLARTTQALPLHDSFKPR